MRMKKIYKKIAEKYGVTAAQVERDITESIKAAFQAPPGSAEKELQLKLFPDGKIPSNKDFTRKMAKRYTDELR